MNLDSVQIAVRALLNMIAGTAIAKGYGDSSAWEAIGGGVVALATITWSHFHAKKLLNTPPPAK